MPSAENRPLTLKHLIIAIGIAGAIWGPICTLIGTYFGLSTRVTILETSKTYQEEKLRTIDGKLDQIISGQRAGKP